MFTADDALELELSAANHSSNSSHNGSLSPSPSPAPSLSPAAVVGGDHDDEESAAARVSNAQVLAPLIALYAFMLLTLPLLLRTTSKFNRAMARAAEHQQVTSAAALSHGLTPAAHCGHGITHWTGVGGESTRSADTSFPRSTHRATRRLLPPSWS